jgi:FkbH-like protein
MLIRREQIVAHRINWSPKSRNLQELAADLNLGLDSFILIEDNPIECAEVRANCPQVLVLQLPDEPTRFAPFLGNVWAFDQLRVTEQDRQRTQSYLDNVRREAVRKDAAGLEDFLSKLQLEVSISPIDAPRLPRAAQLTERTNQFNVSTIRRNEAQLQQLIQDGRHNCQIVGVKDRFGDYGLVGVMITRRDGSALVLDTFLLSCRVLGRGVEHQMLAHAGAKAMEFGLPCVEIPFAPTKKNQPAADFLDSIVSADNSSYRLPAAVAAQVKPAVVTAPQREIEDVSAVARKAPPYQQIAAEWNDPQPILAAVESRRRVAPPQSGYVAARTPREQALADIWQRVLSVDRVGIHDDYFALGGTSVMAVRLVLEIEKVFGRQLPIATLLKAPTIEKLSGLLDDPIQPDDLAVVTLRAEGDGPPLFLLPSIGGHVLSYRLLVQNLDTNHPVYGLEMRPEVPGNRVPRPMERIAAEFLQRILAIEPNGPYLLAGWSFGGSLAFELAHQLRARGKQVPLLVLIDTYCHGYPGRVPVSRRIRLHLQHFLKRSPAEHMRYLAMITSILAEKVWHRLLITLGLRKTKFYAFETPLTEEMVKVCDDSWNSYRPSRWPGHLVLLRAMRRKTRISQDFSDPYNGWGKFAESIEVHDVDANHLGLFEEPAVGRSAAALAHGIRSVLRN